MFLSNSNQLSRLQRGLDDDKVQIGAQRLEIQELTTVLSTNQSMDSATRLAVLDKKDQEVITGMKALIDRIFSNEKIFAGENETTNKHESITEDVPKLKILREERETRQALLKLQIQQAGIERQRSEINSERRANEEALEKAKQVRQEALEKAQQEALDNEQKKIAQQEVLNREQHITDQSLSIFNYVIATLYKMLISITNDTGDKVSYDFPRLPNAY